MEESSLHISDSFLMIPPPLLFQLHCSSMLLHMLSTHMVSGIPNGNFQVRKNSNVINVPHSGQSGHSIKQMLFLYKRRKNKNQIGILKSDYLDFQKLILCILYIINQFTYLFTIFTEKTAIYFR